MAFKLPVDSKLAASIKQRRIAEEQRKVRIFNPKVRTIGVDVDALNNQLHYLKFSKQQEEDKKKAFDEYAIRCDRMANILQKNKEEEIRKLNKEINEFRLNDQRPETRREFDLYDPNRLKKELPARTSDDDPRCSLSGLQKFQGEDLNHKERIMKQKEENRQSLFEQMNEKKMMLDKQNNDLHNLEFKLQQLDRHAQNLAFHNDEESRKQKAIADAEYNQNLARQQKELKRQKEIQEDLEKLKDIWNCYYSDLLTENPYVARSLFGPHRVVPDRWKGMSKEQLEACYQKQQEQIIENKRNKEKEQQEKFNWDRTLLSRERYAILMERDKERKAKDVKQQQAFDNNELAQEQKQYNEYLEKVVYSNVPSEEYYAQFNTTTR